MIGLVGIPYDEKSSFLKGPAKAPPLIREALASDSANLFAENGVRIDESIYEDLGDLQVSEYFDIESHLNKLLSANNRIVSLGGDHSITFPVMRAFAEHHERFDIVHIDAHGDLYQEFEGDPYSHACPFARIMEEDLADRLIQLGIRTLNDHQREQADRYNVEVVEMKFFENDKLPELTKPVYLSLDLDGLDPTFAPGVSHHEPGGFSTRQVIEIIHRINVPIIGADIVEYNPTRDINGVTSMVAAKLLREIMGHMSMNLLPLGHLK